MADVVLVRARYGDEVCGPLIEVLQQEMQARYGQRDATPVDPAQFDPPAGDLVVALVDGEPVGCAGFRRHDARTAELKRMLVLPGHRRRGLAARLLTEVESRCAAAGYKVLLLETGTLQPESVALYRSRGYRPAPAFGHYGDDPLSLSFAKDLAPPAPQVRPTGP